MQHLIPKTKPLYMTQPLPLLFFFPPNPHYTFIHIHIHIHIIIIFNNEDPTFAFHFLNNIHIYYLLTWVEYNVFKNE